MSKLKDALVDQKQQTEQYNQKISGILGIPINGARTVEVAGRKSYVYVRLRSSQNEVIQAFNNRVAPSYNLPVLVERQGNRYAVIDVDTKRYDNNHNSFSPYLPRHGNTHSFDIESGGGGDIVWVYPRQFMPLLALPSGSVGSPNIIVSPYTLKKENGTWMYVGNTGTASFTPYNPTTSGSAVMGLIVLNTDTGNPYFLIGSGTPMASSLTGSSQVYPYIPTLTNPLHIPIAAVRLISGTTRLAWDNIYDVRQFVHGHASGSAAGLSSIDVQDEGVPQGAVTTFDFVGSPVSVTVSGSVAQVTVTATATGSSGSPAFTGTGNSVVLTSSAGVLTTEPWLKYDDAEEAVDFGSDAAGKLAQAGYVRYNKSEGYLDVFGAGTGTPRRVRTFEDLYVVNDLNVAFNSNLNVASANSMNLPSGVTYNVGGLAHSHVNTAPPAYIDGLKISYTTSGSITVSPGAAYIPSLGELKQVTGSITLGVATIASTVSGSWQNVYLISDGTIEVNTTAPSTPYAGVARTKSGDTSRRYIGSVYLDAGGYLYRFNSNVQGNMWKVNWLEAVSAFPFQFANVSGTVTTPTSLSVSWLVPPTLGLITEMQIQTVHNIVAGGDNVMSITDNTGIVVPNASAVNAESLTRMTNGGSATTNIQIAASPLKLTGNSFLYTHVNVGGTNGGFFRSRGYHIER